MSRMSRLPRAVIGLASIAPAAVLLALLLAAPGPLAAREGTDIAVTPRPMPEFPHADPRDWINSAPIRLADLKGEVVLVEIWTSV